MAELLKGKEVADAINEETIQRISELKEAGIEVCLAIVRVGERPDDISYEKGAVKRCEAVGASARKVLLPADVDADTFYKTLDDLNRDPSVHGILMFRPLPQELNNERARNAIVPEKDIDGCSDGSLVGVFTGNRNGFAPCTAEAAIAMLDHYGIELSGKRAVVLGRSLVVGRPLAMMLVQRNATVTICHTRTKDIPSIAREADLLFTCMGQPEKVDASYIREGQTVIDISISWNKEKGKLCGDCAFEEVEPVAESITPVPGGVGAVTTAVLMRHLAQAAKRASGR